MMPLRYKVNVLEALKEKGYNTYKLRNDKLLSESSIQKLREGKGLSWDGLETLCELLECQVGDLVEYVKDAAADAQ